jgi:hypothetical protein
MGLGLMAGGLAILTLVDVATPYWLMAIPFVIIAVREPEHHDVETVLEATVEGEAGHNQRSATVAGRPLPGTAFWACAPPSTAGSPQITDRRNAGDRAEQPARHAE